MTSLLAFDSRDRASLSIQETLEAIEFDASISETHTGSAEATQFPVEEGGDITDHIRRLPEELSINIITTNDPILFLASLRAEPISGFSNRKTRAEDTYTFLKDIKDNGILVKFQTTLRSYKDMFIQSLSCSRDAATNNIVNINLSIREIIIATTEEGVIIDTKSAGRQGESDQGVKPKAATKAPTKAGVVKSGLVKIFGG